MLKKLFILFLSANLFASENIETPESAKANNSSAYGAIGIGIAAYVTYTVIPNLLSASSKSNVKGIDEMITTASRLSTLAGAAVGVYGLTRLYIIGKEVYESRNPSEAKMLLLAEARERNNLLKGKRELRTCLMNNANLPRNTLGRPTACEDLAQMFAAMAGKPELDEITKDFNDLYKDQHVEKNIFLTV